MEIVILLINNVVKAKEQCLDHPKPTFVKAINIRNNHQNCRHAVTFIWVLMMAR